MSKKLNTRTQYRIIGSDFSAQEPRLTAFLSKDPSMIQAYAEDKDLYCVIAAKIYNNRYEENLEFYPEGTELEIEGKKVIAGKKTHLNKAGKERRSVAKTVLLALSYGMGVGTLAERLNKTKQEAQEIFDSFFNSFPKVKQEIDKSKETLKEKGYVEDWAGRRRHLTDYFLPPYEATYKDREKAQSMTFNPILSCADRPQIDSKLKSYLSRAELCRGNKAFDELAKEAYREGIILTANTGRIAQAERQCFNARIQGGAASLTKLAMVNIFNDKEMQDYQAKLIIPVHDELLVECPAFYADKVEKRLPQVMIDSAKPYISVSMKCDPYNVSHWYEDEYAGQLLKEYGDLQKKGLSKNEIVKQLLALHGELSKTSITDILDSKLDYVKFHFDEIPGAQLTDKIQKVDLEKEEIDDNLHIDEDDPEEEGEEE